MKAKLANKNSGVTRAPKQLVHFEFEDAAGRHDLLRRPSSKCCRDVLTGGTGGGKTTAADLFRREIGDRVVIVPEAVTILFQGGFPRSQRGPCSALRADRHLYAEDIVCLRQDQPPFSSTNA